VIGFNQLIYCCFGPSSDDITLTLDYRLPSSAVVKSTNRCFTKIARTFMKIAHINVKIARTFIKITHINVKIARTFILIAHIKVKIFKVYKGLNINHHHIVEPLYHSLDS